MMLTAGLGVSEMTIGCDQVALGGVTPLLLSNDAVEIPLSRETRGNVFSPKANSISAWITDKNN